MSTGNVISAGSPDSSDPLHRIFGATTNGTGSGSGVIPISTETTIDDPNSLLSGNTVVVSNAGLYRVEMSASPGLNVSTLNSDTVQIFIDGVEISSATTSVFNTTTSNWPVNASAFWEGDLAAGAVVDFRTTNTGTRRAMSFSVRQLSNEVVIATERYQYSTVERMTNRTWIDGKSIYERVIDLSTTVNGDLILPVGTADKLISQSGEHAKSANESFPIPMGEINGGDRYYGLRKDDGSVVLLATGVIAAPAAGSYVILRYTKI